MNPVLSCAELTELASSHFASTWYVLESKICNFSVDIDKTKDSFVERMKVEEKMKVKVPWLHGYLIG